MRLLGRISNIYVALNIDGPILYIMFKDAYSLGNYGLDSIGCKRV